MGGEDKIARGQLEEEKRQYEKSFEEDFRRFGIGESTRKQRLSRSQEALRSGEREFLSATEGPLPELEQYRQSILEGGTEAQQRGNLQTQLALKQSGVRGPEAALERARQSNLRGTALQRQLSELAYNEAQGRRGKRADYFAGKAGAATRGLY